MRQDCSLLPGSLVWPYLRVSGEEQVRKVTPIASMKKEAVDYCKEHNLIIGRWFIDEAIPGESTAKRHDFNRMMAEARHDPPDAILLWSWSRFARDQDNAHFFKADLRRRGVEVVSMTDAVPTGEYQYIFEALIHWKDERRREEISSGVKRTFRLLAEAGYVPGGFPPRGYKIERITATIDGHPREVKKWVKDRQWWDLAKTAWEMKAQGASHREIIEATRLYKGRNCLSTFFRNRAYKGTTYYGGIAIPVPRMVGDEIWKAVQVVMDERGPVKRNRKPTDWHPRRTESAYLLSGLLYCGYCGSAMSGGRVPERDLPNGHRAEWRYYICARKERQGYQACPSKKIKAETVDGAVVHKAIHHILAPERLPSMLLQIRRELGTKEDLSLNKVRIEAALKAAQDAIDRLVNAIARRGYAGAIGDHLSEWEQERQALQEQLRRLSRKEELLSVSPSNDAITNRFLHLARILETAERRECRRVLTSFIRRIEVKGEEGIIYYVPPWLPTVV